MSRPFSTPSRERRGRLSRALGVAPLAVAGVLLAALPASAIPAPVLVTDIPLLISAPQSIASGGGRVFVASDAVDQVDNIDMATNSSLGTTGFGNPGDLAAAGDYYYATVTNGGGPVANNTVWQWTVPGVPFDARMIAVGSVQPGPVFGAPTATATTAYVPHLVDETVYIVDAATATVTGSITLGREATSVAVQGTTLIAVNGNDGSVQIVDLTTNAVTGTVAVSAPLPTEAVFVGTEVWVLGETGSISVVSPATATEVSSFTIPGAANTLAAAVTPYGVYVTDFDGVGVNRVVGIDPATQSVFASVDVPASPVDLVYAGDALWTANSTSSTTSRIEFAPDITTATLPNGTVGTAYSQTIDVVGPGTITLSLTSGTLPPGLAFDPTTGAVSGTPTTPGSFTFEITASNAVGTDVAAYTIVIGTAGGGSGGSSAGTSALVPTGASPLPFIGAGIALLTIGAATIAATGRRGRTARVG